MKLLIEPNGAKNPTGSGCYAKCGLYKDPWGGCPYLCVNKCSEKEFWCNRPVGAGMSPSGAVDNE